MNFSFVELICENEKITLFVFHIFMQSTDNIEL